MKYVIAILSFLLLSSVNCNATDYTFDVSKGVLFAWQSTDVACAYAKNSASGTKVIEIVQSVDADSHYANFYNEAWNLAKNTSFNVSYPYNSEYTTNGNTIDALPISYLNQTQTANNSLAHLSPFDYMVAHCTTTDTEADFNFEHYGSVLCIDWKMDEKTIVTSLTLSAQEKVFTTDATMNLIDKSLTPVNTADNITLTLNDVTVNAGESLKAYMMMPPINLFGMEMAVTITTQDGKKLQARFEGTTILPGKAYPLAVNKEDVVVSKDNAARLTAGKTTTVSSRQVPRAFAPDFPIDEINSFKVVPTSIKAITTENESSIYSIDGRKANKTLHNQIYIKNGKKYINR